MIIEIVQKAADRVGGITELARKLGIKHPAFHSWTRVPAERIIDLEAVSGIPRHELRPDLYKPPVRPSKARGGVSGEQKRKGKR